MLEHQIDQSQQTLQRALAIFQDLGVDLGVGRALCHLGRAALARDDRPLARQLFGQGLRCAQRIAATPLLIEAAAGLLQLQLPAPERAEAEQALAALLAHPACTAETRAAHALQAADAGPLALLLDGAGPDRRLEQICALALKEVAGAAAVLADGLAEDV